VYVFSNYHKEDFSPKKTTWWIAVILGALGIIGSLVSVPFISGISFWLVAAAFILLALATYLKGL